MITLDEPKYGTTCEHCFSKENVKEITLQTDGHSLVIRLCVKCRGELNNLLTQEAEAQRDYEAMSNMRDYCENHEPTYNPEDGSM